MKLLFISNVLTPHQKPLCDAFSNIEGIDFKFIETCGVDKSTLPIGWRSLCVKEYLIDYETFSRNIESSKELITAAEVVISGSAPFYLLSDRIKFDRLTFIYSERIYRSLKDLCKFPYHFIKFNRIFGSSKAVNLLCASAFSAKDYRSLGLFEGRTFKWGYFPKVNPCDCRKKLEAPKPGVSMLKILWVARFLTLKHPELPVMLAERLKSDGFDFELNMYGIGPEHDRIKELINNKRLDDKVFLRGAVTNDEIYRQMSIHDIFLFTSDRNEGWGAVLNEAMGSGCAVVASSAIGSVPFLINDRINGMIFKSKDLPSLLAATKYLLLKPSEILRLGKNAVETISTMWSPEVAASRFIELAHACLKQKETPFLSGPCSPAEILSDSWYNHNNNLKHDS